MTEAVDKPQWLVEKVAFMKKPILSGLFLAFLFSCPAGAQDQTETQPAMPLSKKEVSVGMSEIWCQKMGECAKDPAMSIQECQKILYKNFKDGLDAVPKGQKVEIARDTFEQCRQSIQAGTCDSLKSARSLPGCDFIGLLNRSN